MANKLQYINTERSSSEVVVPNSGERSSSELVRIPSAHKDTCVSSRPEYFSNSEQSLKTKDQLIEKIKEWVKIDNEIRILQKEQTKRRLEKKKVSIELMEVMRTNGIDAFDINDGQIVYDKRNTKKPITKTVLMNTLSSYFNGDMLKASEINQYILDNREEVVKERIMRKITTK